MTLASLLTTTALLAATLPAPEPEATVRALPIAREPVLSGPQFIAADRGGHAFLLDGATLSLYALDGDRLTARGRLERLSTPDRPNPVVFAALSPFGGDWLLLSLAGVEYFHDGRQATLPAPRWRVNSIGYGPFGPLASVTPGIPGGEATQGRKNAPSVLYFDDNWKTLRESKPLRSLDELTQIRHRRDLLFAAGEESSLWLAHRFLYRVHRLSSSGKIEQTLELEDREIQTRERSREEIALREQMFARAREAGQPAPPEGFQHKSSPRKVIQAIATNGGTLYLLIAAQAIETGKPALDRWDPATQSHERLNLDLPPYSGRRTMAAGRDGLYIANYEGDSGRWRIPWATLVEAKWVKVEDLDAQAARTEE